MNYEKAYKEALERAKTKIENDKGRILYEDDIKEIFPELVESDDEKIRKSLIEYIKGIKSWNYFLGISKEQMIAWLEKQGEQKYNNNTEPKFKVGDWVVNNDANMYQIKEIDYTNIIPRYELENIDGDKLSIPFTSDYNLRNWTINDANDGDVLAIGNEYFLFKAKKENTSPEVYISHCFADSAGAFRVTNGRNCGEFLSIENGVNVTPAIKEQRELLFQKISEAGYEWNAETKRLIKK